jgi:hypothetical protein
MSRTKKGKKGPGYENWGKRPNSMSPPGKISKQITVRKERAAARALEKKAKRTKTDA